MLSQPQTEAKPKTEPGRAVPESTNPAACGLLRLLLVITYDAIIVVAILMIAGAIALLLPFSNPSAGKDLAYTLYLLLFWFLYLAWCWRHNGMTLGMRAWKVRLLNQLGKDPYQPPRWWQCGLRFIGAFLSLLPAGLGYGWMWFDREQRSWHDLFSQTRLVHMQAARRPEISGTAVSDTAPEEIDRSHAE